MPDDAALWAERALGHRFADERLLMQALTHASLGRPDYERLEFLGDRVLGCVVAAWLVEASGEGEGKLARRFAALVSRDACAAVARRLGVAAHVRMDRAAYAAGVHESDNLLADVAEALIGAVFLDAGHAAAERLVRRAWAPLFDIEALAPKDPKSRLQEWAQGRGLRLPDYAVLDRAGPDHAPLFRVAVTVRGQPPAQALGASKQEAEKNAALAMLAQVGAGAGA